MYFYCGYDGIVLTDKFAAALEAVGYSNSKPVNKHHNNLILYLFFPTSGHTIEKVVWEWGFIFKGDICKIIMLLLVSLLVCMVVYPCLHELGHVVASWCVGAEVQRVTLFPVPSVQCTVGNITDLCIVVIGFGGMVFPALIAMFLPQKYFVAWYTRMLLQGISAMAFVISIFSIVLRKNPQDDMVQALAYWQHGSGMLIVMLCAILVLILFSIRRGQPVKRLCGFFNV